MDDDIECNSPVNPIDSINPHNIINQFGFNFVIPIIYDQLDLFNTIELSILIFENQASEKVH